MKRFFAPAAATLLLVTVACTRLPPGATPTAAAPAATPTAAAPAATPTAAAPAATATAAAAMLHLVVWTRNYTVRTDKPSPYLDAKTKFEAAHPGVVVDLTGVG